MTPCLGRAATDFSPQSHGGTEEVANVEIRGSGLRLRANLSIAIALGERRRGGCVYTGCLPSSKAATILLKKTRAL